MRYLNIKKQIIRFLQVSVFVGFLVLTLPFFGNYFNHKTYALAPFANPKTATYVFSYTDGGAKVKLVVTIAGTSYTAFFDWNGPSGTADPNMDGGTGIVYGYDLVNCGQGSRCQSFVLNPLTMVFGASGNPSSPKTLLIQGSRSQYQPTLIEEFNGQDVDYTINHISGAINPIITVNTSWLNTSGHKVISSDTGSYAGNLKFISPTEIYDSLTKTYYTTDGVGQFATSGPRFINDGDTLYLPTENASNSSKLVSIDPGKPIPGTNTACMGGIVAITSNGGHYADVQLLPTFANQGFCYFGSNNNTYQVPTNGTFYGRSINTALESGYPITLSKLNSQMEYSMFQWTSSNTVVTLNGGSELIEPDSTRSAAVLASQGVNKTGPNWQILTTNSCLNGSTAAFFPFILVNKSSSKSLSNLDIGNSNSEGYIYYAKTSSSGAPVGWTNGWPSGGQGLNCLFQPGSTPSENGAELPGYPQLPGYTYISNISTSICSPTDVACSGSPSSINPTGSTTPSSVCYDYNTGYTYECGPGANPSEYNVESIDPVVDTNYQAYNGSPTSTGKFSFKSNQCYSAIVIPSGTYASQMGWVQQSPSDCSTNPNLSLAAAENNNPLLRLPSLGNQSAGSTTAPDPNGCKSNNGSNCLVTAYINPLIKFLNVAVSLVVVISVVVGGVQYSTSRDNPEAVKAARKRILNALLGFAAYFLLYAFLNFIIPGGI